MNKNTINRPNTPQPPTPREPSAPSPPAAPARPDARPDAARAEPARAGAAAPAASTPSPGGAVDSGLSRGGADARSSTGRAPQAAKKKPLDKPVDKQRVQPQRAARPPRMGVQVASAQTSPPDDEAALPGAGPAGIDADIGDAHKRRHLVTAHLEQVEEHDELHADEGHDSAATDPLAIKRSKGGDGGGDGFEQGQDQREAYERYLKGNVDADKDRHEELRKKGTKDDFKVDRAPTDVEALGTPRATAHVVRLYDAWTLAGLAREEAVDKAAAFLAGFHSVTNIRKVLAELESKPIRDVYPLEVLMRMLEERPELLPGVRRGSVLGPLEEKSVLAGHAAVLSVPTDMRIKSFALLGGARPGYEFQPHKDEDKYTLLVDTPGEHTFALLAAPLQQLGRIQRETSEAILEVFRVVVWAMDKKGEPLSPEEWRARQALEDDDDDHDDDGHDDDGHDVDGDALAGAAVSDTGAPRERAVQLSSQVRRALETIGRDEVSGPGATTYSWDASFYRPGCPIGVDALLHVVVKSAGPFDPAWLKAREALAAKQKEFEPSRAVVTQEDFTAALRRARVR